MKDKLVFSFGRFNPPTTGHEVLLEKVVAVAKKENADAMVYASQSNDPKKNPIPYKQKTKFMKEMFPKHKKVIQFDVGVKNAFDTLSTVYSKGYRDVTMVVGSDRVTEFANILNKYNDVKGKHGYYNFEAGVKVVSAGARDPDAEGVTGMSASKMRAAASANDFDSFVKGMPTSYKNGQDVFDAVRKGMNLSEEMLDFLESQKDELIEFLEMDLVQCLDDIEDIELTQVISENILGTMESYQIDELSPKTKKSYVKKASLQIIPTKKYADNYKDAANASTGKDKKMYSKRADHHSRKLTNRSKGIASAELDEKKSNLGRTLKLVNKIKNSGVVKSGSMKKEEEADLGERVQRQSMFNRMFAGKKDTSWMDASNKKYANKTKEDEVEIPKTKTHKHKKGKSAKISHTHTDHHHKNAKLDKNESWYEKYQNSGAVKKK